MGVRAGITEHMYIGVGALVFILLVLAIIYVARRA
jgi:hypothetical protein